jgi:hypothetical protein
MHTTRPRVEDPERSSRGGTKAFSSCNLSPFPWCMATSARRARLASVSFGHTRTWAACRLKMGIAG